jgi:putative oxidoreductase
MEGVTEESNSNGMDSRTEITDPESAGRSSEGKQARPPVPFERPDRFSIVRWAPIPLRLIVGYGFLEHGFTKLTKGPDGFASILHAIGVPGPHFMAWATILIEIFGGLAVLLGTFVTLASLPMAAVLLVAMFTVHLPYGFNSINLKAVTAAGAQFGPPGYECDLLYLACLASLVLGGSGPLAIDAWFRRRRLLRSAPDS